MTILESPGSPWPLVNVLDSYGIPAQAERWIPSQLALTSG
jgi:hypothetical protein